MQVGEAFNKTKSEKELNLIASDPDDTHAFKVTNYAALDGLLSKLQQSIVPMEGEGSGGPSHAAPAPSAFGRRPEPYPPTPSLPYLHVALWATPVTSLSLSCAFSKRATTYPDPTPFPNLHEALMN